jgi:uncharacterized protein YjaZ
MADDLRPSRHPRFARLGALFAALLFLGVGSPPSPNTDPDRIVISTSDIDLFWKVVDGAGGNPDAVAFKKYFSDGSPGVQGFIGERLVSPEHLAKVFAQERTAYLKARPNMALVQSQIPRLREDLRRYKHFYPQVLLPNVYFVVGAFNSGGTAVDGIGEIMGTEILAKDATALSKVAPIVAHELTHYNQQDAATNDLLGTALNEGSADFIAQLADGNNIDADQWHFGCPHEAALWEAFQHRMYATDESTIVKWLFSTGKGPLNAPPFIGYWLGSRIVQSYYDHHADKRAAVAAILHMRDYGIFLRDSHYAPSGIRCGPQARWNG